MISLTITVTGTDAEVLALTKSQLLAYLSDLGIFINRISEEGGGFTLYAQAEREDEKTRRAWNYVRKLNESGDVQADINSVPIS